MPDLVAVRRILEPAATALAAIKATDEELAAIRSHLPPELTPEQAEAHVQMDYEFHHAIARASGNPLLAVLLDGLAAPTVRMRVWRGMTLPGVLDRTLHEHQAILDALEARDPDLAHAAATMHVAAVETWVRGLEPGWSSRAAREVHAESAGGG